MWATVIVLALAAATDPLRLGWAVVLISQPRPMPKLLAFWLGGMTTGIAVAVGLLVLLRDFALKFTQSVSSAAASSTARHIQLATGVFALLIAAVIAVRLLARQRAKVPVPTSASPAPVLQPSTPTAFSWLPARVRNVLEAKFLWVAFGVGLGSATNPVESLIALAVILESGAAIGTQLGAAVMFTVVVLAVIEIPLISYLTTPVKTEAVMLQLHNWVRAHRPRILTVIVAAAGVLMVIAGA